MAGIFVLSCLLCVSPPWCELLEGCSGSVGMSAFGKDRTEHVSIPVVDDFILLSWSHDEN